MGFVDLSEGMPDREDGIEFEYAVARRCNSLKATLPIDPDFDHGLHADLPSEEEWAAGSRAAMCWVPIFDTVWVGSVIDGTARKGQ